VNPGYILLGNKYYLIIATDNARTFRFLKAQPVDLFLGAHGGYFDMNTKYAGSISPGAHHSFIDPECHHRYGAERENAFLTKLAKYQAKESFAHSCHLLHFGFKYRLPTSA
jgi:metallo-beta-lactamase class B